MADALVNVFVTLFVILDPIGTTPLFIALTAGFTERQRAMVALRATGVALGIVVLFGLLGEELLRFFGISMPAFRVAGGALLFLTAIDMLFERRTERRERRVEAERETPDDPSIFPLAIPLIAGPGAIAAMILLSGAQAGDWLWQGLVISVAAGVLLLQLLLFLLGGPIGRVLGRTGVMVVTRLMGMLLAALAVQFMLDGFAQSGIFGARPGTD